MYLKKNTMLTNGHTFATVLTPVSRNTTISLTRYRITLSIQTVYRAWVKTIVSKSSIASYENKLKS